MHHAGKPSCMRYLYFPLLTFFFQASFAQVRNIQAQSRISEVIVFVEGAQIQRTSSLSIPEGRSALIFSQISPQLDKQSIQVKAGTGITVLSVNHQINYLKEQEIRDDIQLLEEKILGIEDKFDIEKNLLKVYKQEEEMLQKNQLIGGSNGIKTPDLREAIEFQRQKLTEILQKQYESGKKIKELDKEQHLIRQQLLEMNQKKDRNTSEIIVQVSTRKEQQSELSIQYLVKKASWVPTYDIRVKNVTSPIEILHKANISQQSGEDWKDVKLILSTGNPREKGTKPDLQPWLLSYNSMPFFLQGKSLTGSNIMGRVLDSNGLPVSNATVISKTNNKATVTDANGNFSIQQSPGNNNLVVSAVGMQTTEINALQNYVTINMMNSINKLEEVVVTGYARGVIDSDKEFNRPAPKAKRMELPTQVSYQPISTQYEITIPYSVPNDGKIYTTEVQHFEVPAIFEYFAAPKIDPGVYLTASITEWEDLNFMSGETNIFYEGNFLGKSFLDLSTTGDTLSISLGQDKSITVNRKLMKDYSEKKFFGNSKVDSRFYQISIRNNKQENINLTLIDQFPVSTEKEIQVERGDTKGGKIDEKTGSINWTLSIKPKEEIIKPIEYKVKYPKEKSLMLN